MSNEGDEFFGLGYQSIETAEHALVQQCLAYHEEQEALREHRPELVIPSEVEFRHPEGNLDPPCPDTVRMLHTESSLEANALEDSQKQIQQAQERAQAILMRFQQQQSALLLPGLTLTEEEATAVAASPAVFAEQRRVGLERENKRKHLAMLKNFEYLLHKGRSQEAQYQAQIQQAADHEHLAAERYQRQLEERKQRLQGGSQSFDTLNRKKKKSKLNEPKYSKREILDSMTTVALYVSGLSSSSSSEANCDDVLLRQLFGAYGTIAKVHLYRDKQTGRAKGDGLIVYQLPHSNSHAPQDLVHTVCSQVCSVCVAQMPS
jgi:RNA recognition motif. (a.k.a. RRM, RBD, or RNP domain)